MSKRLRCAIYTRKSTEEGLEQEFNSLDAQREACAAFIKSQRGLGWKALTTRYDDGGLSGGTMERPALKALLADIEAGKVDLVVVYKVDRLTRSLTDFSKMVELFDAQGISFVSVTQQFNTSTSMGRLTLNVLLSFAQFEREVTGERIRDKIAASKKKGMWMGGQAPLGYEAKDKKLIIVPGEAETVRALFNLYLDLGSVRALAIESEKRGHKTKVRTIADGSKSGGRPFSRGHLYQLLANPLYAGDVVHKGHRYPGQHEAIVGQKTFEAVQRCLADKATKRRSPTNTIDQHLLTGFIFDDTGDRLCPTHTNKKGKRYRYYISKRLMHGTTQTADGWRLPAPEIERAVIGALEQFLRNQNRLIDALGLDQVGSDKLNAALTKSDELGANLVCRTTLKALCCRIRVAGDAITINIRKSALQRKLGLNPTDEIDGQASYLTISVPVKLQRRGVETKLIIQAEDAYTRSQDTNLISLIANARSWWLQLSSGDIPSINAIAESKNMDASDITRILPLAFLAPDIVQAILEGRQPMELTAERLKRTAKLPEAWDQQRQLLGFPPQ
ncbi:MAG: recombinase family protein [Rhodospirillaceae bacterium]|nr:recombinase family protein [Rhodospirillaceae bacterium]